jgi:uncharacterized repeat protein (TIGR01451 family)
LDGDGAFQLSLKVAPETAQPGDEVEYTLVLTNTSQVKLADVGGNAVLSPELIYVRGNGGLQGAHGPEGYTLRYELNRLRAGKEKTPRAISDPTFIFF